MHSITSMQRVVLLLAGLIVSNACYSQSQLKQLQDSTGLRSYAVSRGDTLLVGFDSAFVLNNRIFKLYQDNYKRVQNGNTSQKALLQEYENLIALQDSMLKEKEVYYQQVKSNFDSLVANSNRFVDRTDMNITAINQSLTTATGQLNTITGLLDDSLKKLKQEGKQRFKWALGGFGIGIGVASVIFLVAK